MVVKVLAAVVFVVGGCATPAPAYSEPIMAGVDVPFAAGPFFGVAWVTDDVFATSFVDPGTREVVLVSVNGGEVARFSPSARPECNHRSPGALTRLPSGELGLAAACINAFGEDRTELYAYDFEAGSLRSLGVTRESAADQAWSPDMSELVYVAQGSLCATLYKKNESEGPIDVEVEMGGRMVPLGEDLAATEDGCTHRGNAGFPAFSADGQTLIAVAAAVRGRSGPHRIDQPWSLIAVRGAEASVLLSDLYYPGGVAWLSPRQIVFAALFAGQPGLWVVDLDGGGVTLVAREELAEFSVDAAGRVVAAIHSEVGTEAADWRNRFVIYDLSGLKRGN